MKDPVKNPTSSESVVAGISREVLGGGLLSIGVRVLALASSILLARNLGPGGYGIYAYAMSVVAILAIPVHMGLPQYIVREASIYLNRGDFAKLRGLITLASSITFAVGLILSLAGWFVTNNWVEPVGAVSPVALKWAIVLLPFIGLNAVWASSLRGFGRVLIAQVPEELVRQTVFIAGFGLVVVAYSEIDPIDAIVVQLAALGFSCIVGFALVRAFGPAEMRKNEPVYNVRHWLIGGAPFTLLAGAFIVAQQVDILMLGIYSDAANVGIYRVSSQIAGLTMFGLTVVNSIVAPRLARLNARRDYRGLQKVVTLGSKISSAFAFPVVAALMIYGKDILRYVFGEEFIAGYIPLAIIAIGQLVNAITGPVGYVLNMSGYAWYSLFGVGVGMVVNVILNWMLIPVYGMEGAAFATIVSLCVWNAILFYFVHRFTGVVSIFFLKSAK